MGDLAVLEEESRVAEEELSKAIEIGQQMTMKLKHILELALQARSF